MMIYLISLYDKIKDTTILMVSDHGTIIPYIYYINNDRKNVSYYDQYYHLHENKQTFVTAYNFNNALGHLLYGDKYAGIKNKIGDHDKPKSSKGGRLFNYIDQMSRTLKNYEKKDTTNICK